MKTKAKIIFTIITFLSFLIKSEAKTNYIEAVKEIPNANLYLRINNEEKYITLKEIRNQDTNELLYSINPEKEFLNGNLNTYNYFWVIDLDETLFKEVSKIIYYGYGYNERTSINWYVATQYLIWDYVLDESDEIYFVDDEHNKMNLYEEEITAIKSDIEKMYTLPSFVEENFFSTIATLKINEEITFTDKNNVLKDMTIPYIGSSNILVDGDKITVSFTEPGDHSLIFTREFLADRERQLYKSGDSPVLLNRGTIDPYTGFTYLTILYPSLTINLVDENNTSLSKKDAEYGIYYAPGELYGKYKTDEEGKIYLPEIYKGDFFLKELSSPYGFNIDLEKRNFKIESDDLTISINKKAILKKVNLRKNLISEEEKLFGSDTTFDIIDTKTNSIYKKVTTDINGEAQASLPYGEFIIKETNSLEGYTKPDDIKLVINENYNEDAFIDINSEKIKGSIKVEIFDDNNNLVIEKSAFKIKDLTTNSYLLNGNSDLFYTTNGSLTLNNISYGNYLLEEIEAAPNYEKADSYVFKIKDNNETLYIAIRNNYIKEENVKEENAKGEYTKNENIIADNSNYNKINVPKTGSNETLITLIISVLGLILGVYICNYNENK